MKADVEDFRIDVADAALADLRERLTRTRWPDEIPNSEWEYGTDLAFLRSLCDYWRDGFDWRAAEDRLNRWPHVRATIDGERVHAIHARSPHPGAMPLLMTHGWPGSVVEFLDVIDPLIDPPSYGGDAADAFHVIAPSIPGYGWSGPTRRRGWHIARVAAALGELMTRLGYDKYGVQGGDWGAVASVQLGVQVPDRLTGIHLNLPIAKRPEPLDTSALTPLEMQWLADTAALGKTEGGYAAIQSTKPQTLAYGLNDSPAGLAGWLVEKFRSWSDCDGDVESVFSRDALLTNIATYWLSGTAGSSARLYFETWRLDLLRPPDTFIDVPTGVATFPKELVKLPRTWVEACFDLRHWTTYDRGGHFAAMEQPKLFVDDVRAFFRLIR